MIGRITDQKEKIYERGSFGNETKDEIQQADPRGVTGSYDAACGSAADFVSGSGGGRSRPAF